MGYATNSGDDSVFVRSYAVLLLLELLHHNLGNTIFDALSLELIYGAVTNTFLGERDYRAFVAGKGEEKHATYYNVRAFLRSLDLQLRFRKNLPAHTRTFSNPLEGAIKRLDPGFYTNFVAQ